MKSGIYRLYWDNCNYYYYGQAINLNKRKNIHYHCLKNKKHHNRKITNIYNRYGLPNFEIIEICEYNVLNSREQYYIDLHYGKIECCNLCPTAGISKGIKRSEDYIKRLSLSKIGKPSKRKGIKGVVKQSEETKAKHRENNKGQRNPFYGKTHTEETRKKLSKINYQPERLKAAINNLQKITREHRQKRLLKIIGRRQSEESKQKTSNTFKLRRKIKKRAQDRFRKTGQYYLTFETKQTISKRVSRKVDSGF